MSVVLMRFAFKLTTYVSTNTWILTYPEGKEPAQTLLDAWLQISYKPQAYK
jgi:hypothetical protein